MKTVDCVVAASIGDFGKVVALTNKLGRFGRCLEKLTQSARELLVDAATEVKIKSIDEIEIICRDNERRSSLINCFLAELGSDFSRTETNPEESELVWKDSDEPHSTSVTFIIDAVSL